MVDVSSVLHVEISQVVFDAVNQQTERIANLEKLVPLVAQLVTVNGQQLELIRGLQDQINKLIALREADNQGSEIVTGLADAFESYGKSKSGLGRIGLKALGKAELRKRRGKK